MKGGNDKHHYETKHRHFEWQYPKNTEVRTAKLRQLKYSYESTNKLLVRGLTQQERATEASFTPVSHRKRERHMSGAED